MKDGKTYVMYGFNKLKPVEVGFFGRNLHIVQDKEDALLFPSLPRKGQTVFGTPKQWLDFINADSDLNYGFKFHLVSVN